ncbi:hypothetical protein H112_05843 [Trichophyton rubrum D6]|uniref:Uncharacterized protein n=2 Tax=Trichophyton TaxID=5550 RepID=A0A022VXJ0_TRIRU|nr:hypothetical protein H100_05857 [Trichophyton rubrum MR850]EZF40131.1 hypothetical protein H102_05826 [Trichophyton rubrum CBS 100081]EZF50756.1 hypothetical protein H103_05854 [Trichophyton rubrum CBS 288.86]EZF61361.1 hypothetical protein H104_05840 [Trichophyton rubrum CBS 289.86]EZF72014.1 hypothetical protein H105_05867 [Trichophyton soudanense CBS 452.61]EZF82668.1 hypothetical protein H110_05848 [Trichophyton rubrum MR1448]EZF93371.1 hypothetical protein H113_05896 [Trichophyton rub
MRREVLNFNLQVPDKPRTRQAVCELSAYMMTWGSKQVTLSFRSVIRHPRVFYPEISNESGQLSKSATTLKGVSPHK